MTVHEGIDVRVAGLPALTRQLRGNVFRDFFVVVFLGNREWGISCLAHHKEEDFKTKIKKNQ
jgi:hypothetical protein